MTGIKLLSKAPRSVDAYGFLRAMERFNADDMPQDVLADYMPRHLPSFTGFIGSKDDAERRRHFSALVAEARQELIEAAAGAGIPLPAWAANQGSGPA